MCRTFVNTHLTGNTRQQCLKQPVPKSVRYQDVVVPEVMALVKIGQEFEQGTDIRGQTFNNWGGNGGKQTNQRQIISRNIERCKWCNRLRHIMSNCYARAKFADESNVMEPAQVASVFVNNAREEKRETK